MNKTDLLKLAERVEAGETVRDTEIVKALALSPKLGGMVALFSAQLIVGAIFDEGEIPAGFSFIRHLDAAKALHDAVLPGWDIVLDLDSATYNYCCVSTLGGEGTATALTPAAAWVAATLRAKAGEGDE